MFHPDGTVRDPEIIASEAVILWLNGWETIEQHLSHNPARDRQRVIDLVYGGTIVGKTVPAGDHSAVSHARILDLLRCVRAIQERIKDEVPSSYDGVFSFGHMDGRMSRYATYPILTFHPKSGKLAIYQETPRSEGWSLAKLTAKELAEPDPAKRKYYSVGPGKQHKKLTAQKRAQMAESDPRKRDVYKELTHRWIPPEIPYGEIVAAHGILDLASLGKLDRIRECLCGNWFFARRSDKKTCSALCRHSIYEHTETYKAKRRAQAKHTYQLKKQGVGSK